MRYKIIESNCDINVVEVDGEIIQLSSSINVEDYLSRKAEPLANTNECDLLVEINPKVAKSKRRHELVDE